MILAITFETVCDHIDSAINSTNCIPVDFDVVRSFAVSSDIKLVRQERIGCVSMKGQGCFI
jgi:hypothetical protein